MRFILFVTTLATLAPSVASESVAEAKLKKEKSLRDYLERKTEGTTPSSPKVRYYCTDSPTFWVDISDDGCPWYEESPYERCEEAYNYAPSDGLSAKDVCCVCGGGTTNDSTCFDDEYWYDSANDGCEWYNSNDPDWVCANAYEYAVNGVSANDACCICGGGSSGNGKGGYAGLWYVKSVEYKNFLRFWPSYYNKVDMATLPEEWGEVRIEEVSKGQYSLKSNEFSTYLEVQGADDYATVSSSPYLTTWETFEIEEIEGGIAFKNVAWGNYLRAWDDGKVDTQTYASSWETFELVPVYVANNNLRVESE